MEANCFGAGCSILGSWLKFNGCMLRDYGMYPKKNCFNIASRKNSDNMKNYFGISKVPIQKYLFCHLNFQTNQTPKITYEDFVTSRFQLWYNLTSMIFSSEFISIPLFSILF